MTTEVLTESFCERCGTRYEFGAPEPMSPARKTRGLMSGLRAYIMSTDTLSDSINDAMRAEEETLAARQIDAFQETFNFCLDCRRYTCVSCWNDDAGRCRSCMPLAGVDDIAGFDERMAQATQPVASMEGVSATGTDAHAWSTAERLTPDLAWPAADGVMPPAPAASVPAGVEPAEVEPVAAEEPVAAPAADEVVVPEPVADIEPSTEPVVTMEAAVSPESEVTLEPTPIPEAPPETTVAPEAPSQPPITAPRRDLRDTFLRGPAPRPAATPTDALPESLAARRSQLDSLGIDDPGEGTVPVGQREQLPYRSSGAGSAVGGSAALTAVWDASTRALEAGAQRASLRPCGKCGLTVSSTARFCRRCGTPQTLSA